MTKLSTTFLLAFDALDKDHTRLLEMVDEITDNLDAGNTENCKKQVLEFVRFSKAHFAREEKLLNDAGFPDVEHHHEHHAQLDKKMDHMLEFADSVSMNALARESLKKELVYFLMDDVITTDLDFKAYINEKQEKGEL